MTFLGSGCPQGGSSEKLLALLSPTDSRQMAQPCVGADARSWCDLQSHLLLWAGQEPVAALRNQIPALLELQLSQLVYQEPNPALTQTRDRRWQKQTLAAGRVRAGRFSSWPHTSR